MSEMKVVPPEGAPEAQGKIVEEHGALVWRLEAVPAPGIYRVMKGSAILGAVSAATSVEEADLAGLSGDVIKDRLAGGRNVTVRNTTAGTEQGDSDRAWVWLAVGAIVALLAEIVLLRVFKT
jgi:hypothetical protein